MSVGRVIVASMWNRVETIGSIPEGSADPSPATLDAMAVSLIPRNCGVKPTVRVLEQLAWRPHGDDGWPTCEDVQSW